MSKIITNLISKTTIIRKIFFLLDKKEKTQYFFILFLSIVMAIIDSIGLASVMPFVAVLTNFDFIESNSFLSEAFSFAKKNFGISEKKDFLILLSICTFFFITTSILARALINFLHIKFSYLREYTIGRRLLKCYIHQNYSQFIKSNSSEISSNILSEVNQIIIGILLPFMNLTTNIIIFTIIVSLLLIINPMVALITGFFLFVFYFAIYSFIYNFINLIGQKRSKFNARRYKSINEALGMFKFLKLRNLEEFFLFIFDKPAKNYAQNQYIGKIASISPRYLIECFAFGGGIILLTIIIYKNNNFQSVLPIFALYIFAAYRLLPCCQNIYSSFSAINFSKFTLDKICDQLLKLEKNSKFVYEVKTKEVNFNKSITFKNVSFAFPGNKNNTLDNINFSITRGSKVAIVGKTGGGKSTLLDLMLGLIEPSQGEIIIDEDILTSANYRSWQNKIGYVSQEVFVLDDSIAKNIMLGHENNNSMKKIIEALEIVSLNKLINNNFLDKYDTQVGERGIKISGGQKQRVAIARALYSDPDILILDEATSALDSFTELEIINSIFNYKKNLTVIMVTHKLNLIKSFDQIFTIDNGKIID
jgi:ABC-type multidrug transport system fused ATPase/permease subunit